MQLHTKDPRTAAAPVELSVATRRFAGIIAVGGGIAGLITVPAGMMHSAGVLPFMLCVLVGSLYAIGIWSGVRLIEGRQGAERLFRWFLLAQIPIAQTGVLSYFFASLCSFSVIWRGLFDFDIVVAPLGGWTLTLLSTPTKSGLGINAFPIAVIVASRLINRLTKVAPANGAPSVRDKT